MTSLNACYIVADETDDWFVLSVESALLVADRFVFVIDRPSDRTWDAIEIAQERKPTVILHRRYAHDSKNADGLQRSVYLDWLKNNAVGEWALVLDTDEVLSDNAHELVKYTESTKYVTNVDCYDVKMRHIWYGLSLEDASVPLHLVPRRLFKVKSGLGYPLVEHPVLQGVEMVGHVVDVQIWHFNVCKGVLTEINKFKTQVRKSNMHSAQDLATWHIWHVLGANPHLQRFNVSELPERVKKLARIGTDGVPLVQA